MQFSCPKYKQKKEKSCKTQNSSKKKKKMAKKVVDTYKKQNANNKHK